MGMTQIEYSDCKLAEQDRGLSGREGEEEMAVEEKANSQRGKT